MSAEKLFTRDIGRGVKKSLNGERAGNGFDKDILKSR